MAFILLLLIRVSSLSYTTQLQHFIIIGYYLYLHYWLIHYTMITTPPELKSIGTLKFNDATTTKASLFESICVLSVFL